MFGEIYQVNKFVTVHLMPDEKFIVPFIEFVKENFDFQKHFFIIVSRGNKYTSKILKYDNVLYLETKYQKIWNYFKYTKILKFFMKNAENILLHSISGNNKILFFFLNQKFLSKCYWVIWGADLYVYNKSRKKIRDKIRHYMRTKIYSKIGHFITYIKGDYELAQEWYGARGEYHECFMYPSNLYKECKIVSEKRSVTNIQIGNSSDPTNNHIEVLEKLIKYKHEDIKIFAPLSYGDKKYAESVILKGRQLFGDKFVAYTEFMAFEKYLEFLSEIDIAIFAHRRQQAMGNTITLLGLGKKVYMRSDITSWQLFHDIKVKVFDVDNIQIDAIDEKIKKENQQNIKEYFSVKNYFHQLQDIFVSK